MTAARLAALAVALCAPAALARAPFLVVLDPGHGGASTGALGVDGTYEKRLTLAIAQKAARRFDGDARVRVVMTRNDDVALDLADRAVLANKAGADAFVSVHCNADPAGDAHGIETYFLGPGGVDPEADAVASRENDGVPVPEPEGDDPMVSALVGDLRHNGTLAEAGRLAEAIQKTLVARFPSAASRNVRQGRFAVLRKASMPAVVVEVGFITHKDEGRRLADEAYQDRLADALHDALLKYAGLGAAPKAEPKGKRGKKGR